MSLLVLGVHSFVARSLDGLAKFDVKFPPSTNLFDRISRIENRVSAGMARRRVLLADDRLCVPHRYVEGIDG